MDIIKVVCGIIYNDDKVLICRRNANKSLGGYWEFPGGKVETGERHEDSLTRELYEELGMEVTISEYFKTVMHTYKDYTIELISYKCKFLTSTFLMTDHDLYEWVGVKELTKWNLAPADLPIASDLVESA